MKIGVIADDLTGANGTGVRLTQFGFSSATIVKDAQIPTREHFEALILDTDSRYCERTIAKQRVEEKMELLANWEATLYSKRIDSTLRGNIGVELDTMLDKHGKDTVAIVVPAFPDSRRIVKEDILYVNNIPLHKTGVAQDPLHPITQSHVSTLLSQQTVNSVASIPLYDNVDQLKQGLVRLFYQGKKVITCDAVSNNDITRIAKAMALIHEFNIISVDPGPLTAQYAYETRNLQSEKHQLLVTIGSSTKTSSEQLSYLLNKTDAHPIYVDPNNLVGSKIAWKREVNTAILQAESLQEHSLILVTTHGQDHEVLDLASIAKEQKVSVTTLAKQITDALAHISYSLLCNENFSFKGVFTSGGDVTASLCSISSASGIELIDEVLPLAAYGRLIEGTFNKMPIVTKGGLVGDETALLQCIHFLKKKTMI
ncbi:four-carbon acid sugar kinase family protein [Evansella cellulosilytica]|uniref:Type III effector Hrp-dependent outer domain protein n=1 Tax=Evansella cellulosilytica (strain ATCC 21833 / DSM 2522 / FERM P-1141 / JCM 9156 / N-4) TaxID=649639 RepID=E6U0H2_EVAC2|nr:four-carbon acid sugar kinase family protein [Evansella cellulosilytica]ADU31417.1 type III effector Hrp-dependent outer domain protein [Evansella cellulosilytica DSM 2522]